MSLSITQTTIPSPIEGVAYAQTMTATGASGAVTWSVTVGALPSGLALDPATGIISGTATTLGAFSFTLQASDGSGPATQAFTGSVVADVVFQVTRATTGQSFTITVPAAIAKMWDSLAANTMVDGQPKYQCGLNVFYQDARALLIPKWTKDYASLQMAELVQQATAAVNQINGTVGEEVQKIAVTQNA